MSARPVLALAGAAALALAGCGSSAPAVGLGLRGPSAAAAFRGVTPEQPGVVATYVAVANSRGADLAVLDPEDDAAVVSPGLVFALSVPTAPRPLHLVATPLGDGPDQADALVVAGPPDGSGQVLLQLVATWDGTPRVAEELNLGPGVPGPILAMIATPAPDATGLPRPGEGRVIVATPDQKITVVSLARGPGGAVSFAGFVTATLGFDAVDLAPAPDGRHLYAASGDLITGTDGFAAEGVAEIDATADAPTAWTVTALDARAPTRAVAAIRVRERDVSFDEQGRRPGVDILLPDAALRVYAALDPGRCGDAFPIGCGIATLDPVPAAPGGRGGLAADPIGALPFRAPIRIGGVPLDILAWNARPAVRPSENDTFNTEQGIRLTPGTGAIATDALALVASSDGNVYVVDLSRFGSPLDSPGVRSSTRLRVSSATSGVDPDLNYFPADRSLDPEVTPQLGLWTAAETPEVSLVPADMADAVGITFGFTDADTWTVSWQGALPGLEGRDAVLVRVAELGNDLVIAFQTPVGELPDTADWARVAPVYDPALGVRVGDVVEFTVDGACPAPELPSPIPPLFTTNGLVDAQVKEILSPDAARWPGGALRLEAEDDPVEPRWDGCLAELAVRCDPITSLCPRYTGGANVRAAGLLLTSAARGYLLRPEFDPGPTGGTFTAPPTAVSYPFVGSGAPAEEALAAACPIPRWPGFGVVPPVCDDACRSACQALRVARAGRRFYLPGAESCADRVCEVTGLGAGGDPLAAGPAMSFRLGRTTFGLETDGNPPRNARLILTTASGWSPMIRAPAGAGFPGGFAVVDRSAYPDAAETGIVFYVPYDGDALFALAPSASRNLSVVLR